MTIENWTYGYNTIPEDQSTAKLQAASYLKQLKNFLVAGGWTVVQCSNATSLSFSDLWNDVTTDFTWAGDTGPRSWITLKSPEGLVAGLNGSYQGDQSRLWLLLHCYGANPYSIASYFTIVPPSVPTDTSHWPTTTNGVGASNKQLFSSTFSNNALFHFLRTGRGHFLAYTGYVGTGYFWSSQSVFPLTDVNHNAATNRNYPFDVYIYQNFTTTAQGVLGLTSGTGSVTYNIRWISTWYTNSTPLKTAAMITGIVNSTAAIGYGMTRDAFSDMVPTTKISSHSVESAATACYVGTFADIEATGADIPAGTVDNLINPSRVFLGGLILPTNTTVQL